MMNISWSSSDHLNADVIDDASGQVLFHIDTLFKMFKKQVTTITDAQGQVVAEYEHRFGPDRATNGFFSVTRRLHAPGGKTYLWKEKSGVKFKLVDAHSEAIVATTRAANLGIRSLRHNIIIEAGPEIVPFLDLIVLSFLVCETERCARMRSNMSVAQVSAFSAAAAVS